MAITAAIAFQKVILLDGTVESILGIHGIVALIGKPPDGNGAPVVMAILSPGTERIEALWCPLTVLCSCLYCF